MIETASTTKSGVQGIWSVGRPDDDYGLVIIFIPGEFYSSIQYIGRYEALTLLTIHAGKELCNYPSLHLPLRTFSFGGNGIDLVNEEEAWRSFLRLFKRVSEGLFRLPRHS